MFDFPQCSIQFPCNCGSVRVNRHDEVMPILGLANAEPALPAITVIANPEPLLFSQFYGLPQCLRSANVNLGSCKPVVCQDDCFDRVGLRDSASRHDVTQLCNGQIDRNTFIIA